MPVTILVADDSATMRKILEMTFQGEDAKVHTVPNGDQAVSRAQDLRPDVVFADASMSGMDGYEVARALKSNPSLNGTAVILMASQAAPFDAERGRTCGVDDHIVKPFDTAQIIDRVSQVLTRPRATAAGGAAASTAPRVPPPPPPPSAVAAPRPPAPPVPTAAGAPQQAQRPSPMRSTVAFGTAASPPAPPAPPPPTSAAPAARTAPTGTVAGGMGAPPQARPAPAPAKPMLELAEPEPIRPAPAPARAAAPGPAPAAAAAAATAGDGDLAKKLGDLGLTADQVSGVLALSREVIERVVWEVVPDLAETIIREEIRRLTHE